MQRPAVPDTSLVGRDIRVLAADSLEGRRTGTAGNDSAAAFIARRLAALRAEHVISDTLSCRGTNGVNGARRNCAATHLQAFVARPAAAAHGGIPAALPTHNVVGLIRGSDPALRGQYVVLGAHFDHLGRSTFGALDPDKGEEIRNGADDNASGTAAVLELARLLSRQPPRRSVLVVLFSGEELGLLGSQYFVEHAPVPLDSVQAMLNFDMVGRLRDDKLIVYGVATATELPEVLRAANLTPPLRISAVGDGFGPSDHSSFFAKNIPVLHFFTDVHEDYHRASDEAHTINLEGVTRVVAFAERITRDLADRPARLTFVAAPVTARAGPSRSGSQAWLGTIPDMAASETRGLRITGVRPGSPADSAGLAAGDIIVELGGAAVTDLYTYTDALYANQPGDRVAIVYQRGARRDTVRVTLGRRGG
ncbi:MAG TPA: M28 family peptidase [Gemmatimonadaceae bacterium]|nr:M28 family peptidase [Gemmatimonadaceae bacterium]